MPGETTPGEISTKEVMGDNALVCKEIPTISIGPVLHKKNIRHVTLTITVSGYVFGSIQAKQYFITIVTIL